MLQIPFCGVAFMPGRLVHTNEILVSLGDSWFAERSAKDAGGIAARRIKCRIESAIRMFGDTGTLPFRCL